jgi:putative copper export protein
MFFYALALYYWSRKRDRAERRALSGRRRVNVLWWLVILVALLVAWMLTRP